MKLINSKSFFSFTNLFFITPFVLCCFLLFGTTFYYFIHNFYNENNWSLVTCFYYASQVLLGEMYGVPMDTLSSSIICTLILYILGSTLLAAAITAFVNYMVLNAVKVAAEERKKVYMTEPIDLDGDGIISNSEKLHFYKSNILVAIGWFEHKSLYYTIIIATIWLKIGIFYGIIIEQWTVSASFFFAISTLTASGLVPPLCTTYPEDIHGGCYISNYRACFFSMYIIIGIPLFTYLFGRIAGAIIENAIRSEEQKVLLSPLSQEDFEYAVEFRKSQQSRILPKSSCIYEDEPTSNLENDSLHGLQIDFTTFMVMELLRLKKIEDHDVEFIRDLFNQIDDDNEGVITIDKLLRHNLVATEELSKVVRKSSKPLDTKFMPTNPSEPYFLKTFNGKKYQSIQTTDDDMMTAFSSKHPIDEMEMSPTLPRPESSRIGSTELDRPFDQYNQVVLNHFRKRTSSNLSPYKPPTPSLVNQNVSSERSNDK